MSRKFFYILVLVIIIFSGLIAIKLLTNGSNDTWLCENGEWVKHGQPATSMPIGSCVSNQVNSYVDKALGGLKTAKELNLKSYTLDLSNQGLASLTAELFNDNIQVRFLNVSHNSLTGALPAEIRQMSGLQELLASYNNLTGIPAEIGQLSQLETIDFSYNNLDTYPNELANLKNNLKTLNLEGNNYSAASINELKQLLPNTEIIY